VLALYTLGFGLARTIPSPGSPKEGEDEPLKRLTSRVALRDTSLKRAANENEPIVSAEHLKSKPAVRD
jgi:hypothetical protein